MKSKQNALSHPAFFNRYVDMVDENGIVDLLYQSYDKLKKDLSVIENHDFDYAYAEKKWTIKTLIRHCIDAEIIFFSRALLVARNDKSPIKSFNENDYADESISDYNKQDLIAEFLNARNASCMMFKSFKEEWIFERVGITDKGDPISLLSVGHIIVGHWLHHKKVLSEKYGIRF